jgi:SAM-dependent methyltransferase
MRACPVCESILLEPSVIKFGIDYVACKNCDAVFSDAIDPNIIVTHNDSPETRANVEFQKVRLERVMQYLGRRPDNIFDFGCGAGNYVNFLNGLGLRAVGVDQDTLLKISDFSPQSFDVINMVEVIEHLGDPCEILRQLAAILKPGGIIYGESSFVDFLGDPARSDYIDPRIGHCCIHSRRSIDYLAWKTRLRVGWVNNNVFVFRKG